MKNILIDKESLKVVGLNRPSLSFEIEIQNVDPTGLEKEVNYNEKEDKIVDGKQIYLLPQSDKEVKSTVEKTVETTEITNSPIMITDIEKVPVIGEDGKQLEYQPTQLIEVVGEDGTVTYEEQPVGGVLKVYTTKEVEVQKKDASGKNLYSKQVQEEVVSYEPQSPLEITDEDPAYVEGLEKAQVEVSKTKTVKFEEDMFEFDYDDIVACKELNIIEGTLYKSAVLVEKMDVSEFDLTKTNGADFGFGFVSLQSGGKLTSKITLQEAGQFVGIYKETSADGIKVTVNGLSTDKFGEVALTSSSTELEIVFENTTDKRVDISAFAVLV